jgi:hypothetical protein
MGRDARSPRRGSAYSARYHFLPVNPHPAANASHVTYYREDAPPIVRDYPLAPNTRFTIDAAADADLVDQSFGALIESTHPIVVERSMYNNANGLVRHQRAATPLP